jgi:hypothetical protein
VAVPEYSEIESPREIRHLNKALSARLRDALLHQETRTIGSPHGSFRAKVQFLSDTGNDVFYWRGWVSKNQSTVGSLFGHGVPGSNAQLNIDVQFNFPMFEFSRKFGGAFLRHVSTNRVILAHRGIVTLGHGRVPKADLFSEIHATVREADTGTGVGEFVLIGELESPPLINDIDAFSSELRRAVRAIKARTAKTSGDEPKMPSSTSTSLGCRLRQYFDEFSGKRQLKGRRRSVADCYHGTVVRKVRDAFDGPAETLKSQAVDLTVITGKRVYLFEVKTSSNPQSIYTAIGQLAAHAPAVADYAPGRLLIRVMVLPEPPNQRLCSLMKDQLGIRLLTFTRSGRGRITVDGLERLK